MYDISDTLLVSYTRHRTRHPGPGLISVAYRRWEGLTMTNYRLDVTVNWEGQWYRTPRMSAIARWAREKRQLLSVEPSIVRTNVGFAGSRNRV